MATLTIEVPDDLMEHLDPIRDRLPELLKQCLQPTPLPAQVYRHILDFLAGEPSPQEIAAFRPTAAMQTRLKDLLTRNAEGQLTPDEAQELNEYERIEHFVILIKSGNLPYLRSSL